MIKHTPGPWEIGVSHVDGDVAIREPEGECVAVATGLPEQEANAKLIAVAPKMLSALLECEVLLGGYPTLKRRVTAVIQEATT